MILIDRFNITNSNLPYFVAKIQDILEHNPEKHIQGSIFEKEQKRTNDQNSRLWDIYTSIGNYIKKTKDNVHELMSFKYLSEEKEICGEKVITIKSTTDLTIKEMSDYQEKICAWAANLGWLYERDF